MESNTILKLLLDTLYIWFLVFKILLLLLLLFHLGWWEHEQFLALCELQEYFWLLLSCVFFPSLSHFLSCMHRSVLRQSLLQTPLQISRVPFLCSSFICATMSPRTPPFVISLNSNLSFFSLKRLPNSVLLPGNCLQEVRWCRLTSHHLVSFSQGSQSYNASFQMPLNQCFLCFVWFFLVAYSMWWGSFWLYFDLKR